MQRVLLLYNTDYDEELLSEGADVSAVQAAASAVRDGIAAYGLDVEMLGVHGEDLKDVVEHLSCRPADLVFNIVESLSGDTRNEQVIPAVLDLLKLPYTGPDALAIGLCLHKQKCKHILRARNIKTPESVLLQHETELIPAQFSKLEYPYFLKLAREDASIGIDERNKVACADALCDRAGELLRSYRQPVLAERYIAGREVNVTVLGNTLHESSTLSVLPLHEIDFGKMPPGRPHIISYAAKWDEDHMDYIGTQPVPMAEVSESLRLAICKAAKEAFGALGLRDFGRIDLRVDANDEPWVIDVNPNCDLSPDAGVARAAAYGGMSYPELVGRICELAWERHVHTHPNPRGR